MQRETALYIISVAARLVELHPNTLRKYEREGFLIPSRTGGKFRLYSAEDIARLRQIKYLVEERGVNLAGVEIALSLTERILDLDQSLAEEHDPVALRREVESALAEMLSILGSTILNEQ